MKPTIVIFVESGTVTSVEGNNLPKELQVIVADNDSKAVGDNWVYSAVPSDLSEDAMEVIALYEA